MRPLTRRTFALAIPAASLVLAACGASSPSSSTASPSSSIAGSPASSSKDSAGLAFAACMRSHGISNFPDPQAGGSLDLRVEATPGATKVNGVEVNGPAFQSALQACRSKLPNGGKPPALSPARRTAMLRFSQCMRAHGLTNFPDPQFGGGGGAVLQIRSGTGLDPNSPSFKAAQAACGAPLGKLGPPRPGGP